MLREEFVLEPLGLLEVAIHALELLVHPLELFGPSLPLGIELAAIRHVPSDEDHAGERPAPVGGRREPDLSGEAGPVAPAEPRVSLERAGSARTLEEGAPLGNEIEKGPRVELLSHERARRRRRARARPRHSRG